MCARASRQPPDKLFTNTPLLFELVESGWTLVRRTVGREMSERRASAVTKNECPISLASFRALKLKGRNSISRWGRRCELRWRGHAGNLPCLN